MPLDLRKYEESLFLVTCHCWARTWYYVSRVAYGNFSAEFCTCGLYLYLWHVAVGIFFVLLVHGSTYQSPGRARWIII